MNVMEIEQERTLYLASELMDCLIAREKFGYARVWRSPYWWARKKITRGRLERYQIRILDILMARYKGVISQILKRAGTGEENIETALWEIWIRVQDGCPPVSDYQSFSKALWKECMEVAKAPVPALKPKLMLRQFVDEMQSSDERGILIDRAYNSDASNPPAETEVLKKLSAAYALLHYQLLNHEHELSILSDGELTPEMIKTLKPPYVQYMRWLFDS